MPAWLELTADLVARPYAHVILSRNRISGLLMLLAVFTFPSAAVATLVGVAVAHTIVIVSGYGMTAARYGLHAAMAALSVLAVTQAIGVPPVWLVVATGVLAVGLTSALQALFARSLGSSLSFPVVAAAWVMLLAMRVASNPAGEGLPPEPAVWLPGSWILNPTWLDLPAALLFLHGAAAGVLVLLALAWHSRVSLALGAVGAGTAAVVRELVRADSLWSVTDVTATFNAVLTAIAVGGVWFVPHPSSIAVAAVAAALSVFITYALTLPLGQVGLPLLSLPFALATLMVVVALRQRERDDLPASAPAAERPEDAVARHVMRVRRFGESSWLPFRLPFRGAWTVTQGHNGTYTHRGPWRYAFDFEVPARADDDPNRVRMTVTDFGCYGLPVLAAGSGTVDQVIDGIADNPIGRPNTRDNWGNTVVIAHGPQVYSVYAHLIPRSIRVKPGDIIKAGAELGRCGNSGRSLVPHLHFQVQRGPVLGSETVPAEFGDVVRHDGDRAVLAFRVTPREGDTVRPAVRDDAVAQALAFPPGATWVLTPEAAGAPERATVEIDLWGQTVLTSSRGRLYLESYDAGLVVMAFEGKAESLLRLLRLALGRVPFDHESGLSWSDRVPRPQVAPGLAPVLGVAATLLPGALDLAVTYHSQRREGWLTVDGVGPGLRTRAAISLDGGAHRLDVTHGSSTTTVFVRPEATELREATR